MTHYTGIRTCMTHLFSRSNLVGMGIIPLQFNPGESTDQLGLTGKEIF